MLNLTAYLANLPEKPGVYRMLDQHEVVLYVGKATNLKKRVTNYFKKNNDPKTCALVSQIAAIEVVITRSETEALLLESNLIKSLRPKYNVLMRDDKTYPYIYFNSQHPFPSVTLYRSKHKPIKGEFYGPYPSALAAREALNIIQKVFKIRNCNNNYFSSRARPCLQYQIKQCSAPCTAYINNSAYQQAVSDARNFLQGKSQIIIKELEKRMQQSVARLAFEDATIIRDQIKRLRLVQEQQGISQLTGDADIIAIEARVNFACIQLVTVRKGQILAKKSFFPSLPTNLLHEEQYDLWYQIFSSFIAFYYVSVPSRIPPLLITHQKIENLAIFAAMLSKLRNKKCCIQINPHGKKARWLDFALNNLQMTIANFMTSAATMQQRWQALGKLLQEQSLITRIECFDVSHTQGMATVASCVVFDAHGPAKKEYRRFNITGICAGDDYAALQQAISRRFKRLIGHGQSLPNVLLIDGGRGQVKVANKVMAALKITTVLIVGIAKGVSRKVGQENLILPWGQEIILSQENDALLLLQNIRDEAHRFAITAHRGKRHNLSLDSDLRTITGIGPKKRHALLQRFGGIRSLREAPLEEIIKVDGINKKLALRICNHFQLQAKPV